MKKTKLQFLILIFILLIFDDGFSQVSQEWNEMYDGNLTYYNSTRDMKVDNVGNIYVAGSNSDSLLLIKYNSNGNLIWARKYEYGNSRNFAKQFAFDNSFNVYLIGISSGKNTGDDYVTMKYDSAGNQKWVSRYTSEGNHLDAPYGIAVYNSNNVYVTGQSYNQNTFNVNCVTIKYDSLGNQVWINSYGSNNTLGAELLTDKEGNVYVTGRASGIFTLKYDQAGNQEWIVFYDFPIGTDSPRRIQIDGLGNIYVAGVSIGDGFYLDYVTLKYNSSGMQQWVKRYNGTSNYEDQLNDMKIDSLGNVYVTGGSAQTGRGYDFTTIKYNTDGDELWVAKYHNGLNDIATALCLDNSGNVYITGRSDGNGSHFDYATVKYDSNGNPIWEIRYDYSPEYDDEARKINLDNKNNLIVTGITSIWGHSEIVTIKYSQTLTGVYPSITESPTEFNLSQNYPNPFNPSTNLEFGISNWGFVTLKVYDILGNEVASLVNETKPAGSYEVEFDGSNYASGIYFYRLEVNGKHIDTKRMILLK